MFRKFSPAEDLWATALAETLHASIQNGSTAAVTWYNHFSILQAITHQVEVEGFTYVGIDGQLLNLLLKGNNQYRTSADLVLPILLRNENLRVGVVGGSDESLKLAIETLEERVLGTGSRVVYAANGFGDVKLPPDEVPIDVLILGAGAPLQDLLALECLKRCKSVRLAVTCGGWLDQISQEEYYPSYAYTLRINWLIRLLREPRRLWKRYTIDALNAVRHRGEIRESLSHSQFRATDLLISRSIKGRSID